MTTPKRILCISRAYGEGAGGMERLSFELISELKKNPELDVREIVHETKKGISLFSARVQSVLFVMTVLPRAIHASKDVHLVHIGDPVLSFVGWCVMRLRNIPVVVTVHGLDVAYSNLLYQLYLALFFRSFSTYIPISEYASKLVRSRQLSGAVAVIPPGIRDTIYDPTQERHALSRLLNRDISASLVLATTGRLVRRKGHAWFIQQVVPSLPNNVFYVVAGDGPERSNLSKLVRSLNLQDRVLLLGRISDEDQKTLLNTIDAFIQPNIAIPHDIEGFGIAPLEAALCGKPVFAAQVDGIPSAIHNGKNGMLLLSPDATLWLNILTVFLRTTEAFEPRGDQARTYTLETFNWKYIAERYVKVFNETISSHSRQK
jgi:phosphatidyl-myo-inositol dimannoside synthase